MNLVRLAISALIFLILPSACVSVRLDSSSPKKSQKLNVQKPDSPYAEIFLKDLDYAWRSKDTGDTIGLFSECHPQNSKDLYDVRRELLSSFHGATVISESSKQVGSSRLLRSLVSTKELKTTNYTDLAIYKAEDCVYIASHVSVKQGGSKEYEKFLTHLEGQL